MNADAPRRTVVLSAIAALVAGLAVGVLGTFKHQYGVSAVTRTGWPIGLVAALATVTAFLVALRLAFPSRWIVVAAAVGVLTGVFGLTLPGPSGGDTVILGGWVGVAWLWGSSGAAAVVCAWPRRRAARGGPWDTGG